MPSLRTVVVQSLVRFIRKFVEVTSCFILKLAYYKKKKELPPITNPVLLEPAGILAEKIRKQQLRSTDLVKAYISRIRDVHPYINAMADERFYDALEEARLSDELVRSGKMSLDDLKTELPLLGVPVSIKEVLAVEGLMHTGGLVSRREIKATEDSEVVRLVKKAGGIPLVATNVSELCLWWESKNNLYGVTNNPYDTTKTAGGSSGGEAAILASAASVIGVGNDMGGSIRLPAFFTGIFGHKPTSGVVSNQGMYPMPEGDMASFLAAGPMCRYASDLLPLLKILVGDRAPLLKLDTPVDLSQLRVYYMEDDGGHPARTPVQPEIKDAILKVVKHCETKLRVPTEKINVRKLKHSFRIWADCIKATSTQSLTSLMADGSGKVNATWEMIKWTVGKSNYTFPLLLVANLQKGTDVKPGAVPSSCLKLRQEFQDLLGDTGIFLFPCYPQTAPHHNTTVFRPFNVGYCAIFNVLGLPVTQCPLGLSSGGLPIGVQVVGNLHNDRLTLAVARELEDAFGGWVCPSKMEEV